MAGPRRLQYDPYRDYYVVLGISPAATPSEIQRAYRARAKDLHPDRNPSADATAQFQLLNEAYQTLRDPEQRDLYNLLRLKQTGERLPPLRPDPQSTAGRGMRPARPGALRGLLSGPYRMIILILAFVAVINIAFILLTRGGNTAFDPAAVSLTLQAADRPQPGEGDTRCTGAAVITEPQNKATVKPAVTIRGSAPAGYLLEWTPANVGADGRLEAFNWQTLLSGSETVQNSTLAGPTLTSIFPSSGRIRLRLSAGDATCEVTFTLQP